MYGLKTHMCHVLIIARNTVTRAIIGAQLIEEGFKVTGTDDMASAISSLKRWGIKPDIVIMDTLEMEFSAEATRALTKLCPGAPLIIIHGAWNYTPLSWQAEQYEFAKPVSVGQVVAKVKELKLQDC